MGLGKGKNCWETSPGNWAWSFKFKGNRHNGTLNGVTKKEAEKFVRDERERVKRDHYGKAKANGDAGSRDMRFEDAVDRYIDEVGQHQRAKKLAEEEEKHFDWLLVEIGEDTPITRITDADVAKVVAKKRSLYRHGKPHLGKLSNAYVNRTTTDLLSRVLTRARTVWKIPLPDEPNWKEHLLEEKVRVREMSYEEENDLADIAREDYWDAFEFTLITGLRKMNVVDLTWAQVDWASGVIRVKVKWDKPMEIRITGELAAILRRQIGHHPEKVFTFEAVKTWANPKTRKHTVRGVRYPITKSGYESAWRQMKKLAKVTNLTIHDLRKTRGSRVVRATGNIAAASKALGHSSIAVTALHYAHITPDDVAASLANTMKIEKQRLAEARTRRAVEDQKSVKSLKGNAA